MYQADLLLSKRYKKSYLIIFNDGHFSVHIGSSYTQLKDFKCNTSNDIAKDITLAIYNNERTKLQKKIYLNMVIIILSLKSRAQLLSKCECFQIRSIIVLISRCDTYKGKVINMGL